MNALWGPLSLVGSAAFLLGLTSLVPCLTIWQFMGTDWARGDSRVWPQRMRRIARAMGWSGVLNVGGGSLVLLAILSRGLLADPSPPALRAAIIGSLGVGLGGITLGSVALGAWLLFLAHAGLTPPTSAILRRNLERFEHQGQLILVLGELLLLVVVTTFLVQQASSTWSLANATGSIRPLFEFIVTGGFFVQMVANIPFMFLLPSGSQR